MAELGDPLRLPCGAILPNRLAKAAMTEGLAAADGQANPRHSRLYRRWAAGGAGLLVTGNVMVDWRWLERPGNVVVEDRSGRAALADWAEAGTAAGNHLWMQISHPGRQCTRMSSSRPVSASSEGLDLLGLFARPRALTGEEVADVIQRFATTAAIARETGFTGVQVHSAHGYLLAQFLSPVTNRREDEWGGALENRARLLLEIVRAVRRAVGDDFPVAVKLNSADFQKGGFDLPDCIRVAQWLAEERIDLLEVSGGTYEQPRLFGHEGRAATAAEPQRASTRRREAYFLEYAREIRTAFPRPMMVTGGFRSRAAMAEALSGGELDVIGLARPVCTEPDLPGRLAVGGALSAAAPPPLRFGKSRLSGPASPLMLMKFLNIQGEMAWYYRQILRLADGVPPDPALAIGRALAAHVRDEFRLSRARRKFAGEKKGER